MFSAKKLSSEMESNMLNNQMVQKYKKMLHDGILTDMHLISKDKKIVKCHRAILAASSDVIQRHLETQTENEEFDLMEHLSFKCINVVLSYMYYGDVSEVNTSVGFAIQVLEAALEFHLVGLMSHVWKYLKNKPYQEFSVIDAVNLQLSLRINPSKMMCASKINEGTNVEEVWNSIVEMENEAEEESEHENTNIDDKSQAENTSLHGNGLQNCVKKTITEHELYQILAKFICPSNKTVSCSCIIEIIREPLDNLDYTNDNNKYNYLLYWILLKKKSLGLIIWYYENDPDSLKEAHLRHLRVNLPILLPNLIKTAELFVSFKTNK